MTGGDPDPNPKPNPNPHQVEILKSIHHPNIVKLLDVYNSETWLGVGGGLGLGFGVGLGEG